MYTILSDRRKVCIGTTKDGVSVIGHRHGFEHTVPAIRKILIIGKWHLKVICSAKPLDENHGTKIPGRKPQDVRRCRTEQFWCKLCAFSIFESPPL